MPTGYDSRTRRLEGRSPTKTIRVLMSGLLESKEEMRPSLQGFGF